MDNRAYRLIEQQLQPHESILWAGQPKQGLLLQRADAIMIPISLLWGGFALVWEYLAYRQGAPLFFMLFGAPFVVIGLYMMVGRFYFDARQRKQTYYGITNQRVILLSGARQQHVQSLELATLPGVSLTEFPGGSGAISFASSVPLSGGLGAMSWPGVARFTGPRFNLIDNSNKVFRILRDAQRNLP